mmetsp:Transcript_89022/g.252304  ORF Transcript_89022/g.252304 Transcript_89022/m.252304 type:complete len:235 (+) Transcript_89022:722-1426(+)
MSCSSWASCPSRSVSASFILVICPCALNWPCSRSAMSCVFLPTLFWHRSLWAMSSCSSLRIRSIKWLIITITLSKWPPSFALAATCARTLSGWGAWGPARACLAAGSWMNVSEAFMKVAVASGAVRIAMAWLMPWRNSVRSRSCSAQFSAVVLHESLVFSKKSSSASTCSLVRSRRFLLSAFNLALRALSVTWFWSVFCNVLSSASFSCMNSSKPFCLSASPALSFSSSAARES